MLLSHRCSLAWVSSTNTAIYQASVHSCRAWANGAWQYNHAGVNYLGDGIQHINLPGVSAQLCSMSQWSVTGQSHRCSLPWGWCPAHSLPGVRAQLCSISQQSATVQSRRCSIPWGWSPTHQLTWCQCTVVQHEPTERDVGFTHGVHQLGDGVQHKLLLQHALLQVLLQHWLQALQVAGILGSLGNTHYTLSLSGHTWKPGLPWYNRSGWLGVKHPGYLLGNLGNIDNTLSLFRHTWRPRQHTLYPVTVQACLEA